MSQVKHGLESCVADPELCTEAEITAMVHAFYEQVRLDPQLGPIFNSKIHDWGQHLAKLVDFWSSLLRGTGRFAGTPMSKHIAMTDLSAALFQRWLALFHEVTAEQANRAMAQSADAMAERIAQSLWYGYQLNRHPGVSPKELAHG